MSYSKENFFLNTKAEFKEVETILIIGEPDYISNSGSEYWFDDKGVYRLSDHQGNIGNCQWEIYDKYYTDCTNLDSLQLGFAEWGEFEEIPIQKQPVFIQEKVRACVERVNRNNAIRFCKLISFGFIPQKARTYFISKFKHKCWINVYDNYIALCDVQGTVREFSKYSL